MVWHISHNTSIKSPAQTHQKFKMFWLKFCLQFVCIRYVCSDVGDILAEESLVKTLPEAIIQSNNLEGALAQLDQLSLVTRFTGTGYNIIEGNPEGDFNIGGVDPGVKTTNVIFAHTYSNEKKAFYQGRAMDVPDQVNFHMSESCASSHSVQAYSGRKSYMIEAFLSQVGVFKLICCNSC